MATHKVSVGNVELVSVTDGQGNGGTGNLVVTTHIHPSHVGWNMSDWGPNFLNARYLVPRADWEYCTQPALAPLEGLV